MQPRKKVSLRQLVPQMTGGDYPRNGFRTESVGSDSAVSQTDDKNVVVAAAELFQFVGNIVGLVGKFGVWAGGFDGDVPCPCRWVFPLRPFRWLFR